MEKPTRQKMVKSACTSVNTADMNGLNGVMQADTRNIVLPVAMFFRHSIKEICFGEVSMKKIDAGTKAIIALIVALVAFFAFVAWINTRPPAVYQFELSEIADGVYAYRETTVSSIPAENYTMATVCGKSGNILTIRGTVKVVNQNDCPPYAVWEDSNIVNGDIITIYAPANTVEYLGAVSIGRR